MSTPDVYVRNTRPGDFAAIKRLSERVYPTDLPWSARELASHLDLFPQGQFVAVERGSERVLGMAASLVIAWEDYTFDDAYLDFIDGGTFTNHDPAGRTLYGAEVMVHPDARGLGVGGKLYAARRALVEEQGLLRIRAGARLAGYSRYAAEMDAETYVRRVIAGELRDPTISFQLRHGFHVLAVLPAYFHRDPKSRGYAVLIEWLNPNMATPLPHTRFMTER